MRARRVSGERARKVGTAGNVGARPIRSRAGGQAARRPGGQAATAAAAAAAASVAAATAAATATQPCAMEAGGCAPVEELGLAVRLLDAHRDQIVARHAHQLAPEEHLAELVILLEQRQRALHARTVRQGEGHAGAGDHAIVDGRERRHEQLLLEGPCGEAQASSRPEEKSAARAGTTPPVERPCPWLCTAAPSLHPSL